LVEDEDGNLLADSHNILNRRKNHFSQLLNLHSVGDVRQMGIHTAGSLVHESRPSRLKRINLQVLIKFRQNWIKQEVKHNLLRSINSLILFGIMKIYMGSGSNLLLYQFKEGR
jgi:hypothetical protein